MKIHTLWKMWDDDNVELLFALDEWTVEQNWEAWDEGCKVARKKYGITDADTREVVIEVPHASVAATFLPVEVVGSVSSPVLPAKSKEME